LTVGQLGRAHTFDAVAAEHGFGTVHSVAFSKGAFLGLSVEGSVVGARNKVNQQFYGRTDLTSADLLNGAVEVPTDKVTVLDDVYAKLRKLSAGSVVSVPASVPGAPIESLKESDIRVDAEG
jgi:lipid-binding SYLF domain-containing protein